MEHTDGETRGGDGHSGPASRKQQNNFKKSADPGSPPVSVTLTPEQLAATRQFLQTQFKTLTAAILVYLAGNVGSSEILHPFTHDGKGGHKTPPITNTTRRKDRGATKVEIQQAEGDDDVGSATGNHPTNDGTELVPCEAAGVGCLNRVPSGFCQFRQHLCLVAPHPDFIMELPQKIEQVLQTVDRLVCGQKKLLLAAPVATVEPVSDAEAVRVFGVMERLGDGDRNLKAPLDLVFRLLVFKGFSQRAVAVKCECSPGLISARVAEINRRMGRPVAELRALASHLSEMEVVVKDSRARKIYQPGLVDDTEDEGET